MERHTSTSPWLRVLALTALLGLAYASLSVPAMAQATPPVIDDISDIFEGVVSGYVPTITTLARQLFWILFGIQWLIIGLNLVVRGPSSLSSSSALGFENPLTNIIVFIVIGALGWVIVRTAGPWGGGDGWVNNIFYLFEGIGREINSCAPAPAPCIEPSTVVNVGGSLFDVLFAKLDQAGWGIFSGFGFLLGCWLMTLVIGLCYLGIAIQLGLTMVVFEMVIVFAPIFVAFIIFRPVSGLASGYLGFIVYLGIKIMFLYLLAAVAVNLGDGWRDEVATIPATSVFDLFRFHFQLTGAALFLLILAIYLPGKVASVISSRLDLDLGALMRPQS